MSGRPPPRRVAVWDIGKTNAKLALVDMQSLSEIAVRTRPNTVRTDGPYPHYDIDGLWDFLLDGLSELQAEQQDAQGIDAISITTHGASLALLDSAGGLACPVLDYEHTGPDDLAEQYDAIRPGFARTGSPRLPMGLNAGAQLHWLLETQTGLRDRLAQVVTYPQFWSGRLTGRFGCEYTSLGCHTDLWMPREAGFSPLVAALGLEGKMAPLNHASDCAGHILPQIAARTGLAPDTPVMSGIHDSNASLLPHLRSLPQPFAVVSTGTWVISMAVGGRQIALDPARDLLINVNADGGPTPSARFMGGREYDLLKAQIAPHDPADVAAVLARGAHLRPSVELSSGPFPGRHGDWTEALSPGEKSAALAFYLGLMTAECLSLIGAEGPVVVEGPFARNALLLDMLAVATGREVACSASATGTSIGAALLAAGEAPASAVQAHEVTLDRGALDRYAAAWRVAVRGDPSEGSFPRRANG
ncbi:FGGY-family carbohydrate kinase [Salipiger sp. PrR002]|uniref:FGGY-family carbohydrate kinase n=1 Tax=Salipiger sp. PrR002 TaxID=2706489 RepID=UPI0013B80E30|nr:FGGY-family carbohydrate kinase [Salipiger sp. PrR002]NDV98829.1 carbohydrate kinase [Salipiger sp. PrR002]NDW55566.1 carbohydrate kinase [Salipiger sp. PrR004]